MPKKKHEEYDLVMPFVSVVSKGGPFDDESYAAGWRMGVLDLNLALINSLMESPAVAVRPVPVHSEVIRMADLAQADLIAMQYRFAMKTESTPSPGWVRAVFVKLAKEVADGVQPD